MNLFLGILIPVALSLLIAWICVRDWKAWNAHAEQKRQGNARIDAAVLWVEAQVREEESARADDAEAFTAEAGPFFAGIKMDDGALAIMLRDLVTPDISDAQACSKLQELRDCRKKEMQAFKAECVSCRRDAARAGKAD